MLTLRAFIITLLCFIVAVGTRCSCCKCDEVDVKYTSTFKELQLASLDNTGRDIIPAVNNTVNKKAYAIKMTLVSATALIARKPCHNWNLFVNEANAMGCRCNDYAKYIATDSISAVSITDLEPFDAAAPAGIDVTSKFRYYNRYPGSYEKIEDVVNGPRSSLFYPAQYIGRDSAPVAWLESTITFMLMEPPAISGIHRFKVSVLLKSGLKIEQTTLPVTLQ